MRIDVIDSSYRTRNHYLIVSVVAALRSRPDVSEVRMLELADALVQTRSRPPDVLIVFGGEQCENYVICQLSRAARVSVVWFTEDPFEIERNLQNHGLFDLVFTNDKSAAARYGSKGHHLPLAANAGHAGELLPFAKRRYDISFVGTLWPNRARFFAESHASLGNIKTKFELVGNEHLRAALAGIPTPYPVGTGVDYLDFMRINRNSRISLMIDREFSGSGRNQVSDTPGPRFFEAASTGACVFVDVRGSGDIDALGFVPNEDYFRFSNIAEFASLIAEFKESQAPFEIAARALRDKVLQAHTYAERVGRILDLVKVKLESASVSNAATSIASRKPKILALAHNLPEFGRFGGGELYLQTLIKQSPQYDFFILAHDDRKGFGKRYVLVNMNMEVVDELVPKSPNSDLYLRHEEIEAFFLRVVEDVDPDLLFINHLLGFPPAILPLARHIGLTSITVLHDYHLVCDAYNLLMADQVYCGGYGYPGDRCDLCTYKRRGLPLGSQLRRRNFYRYALQSSDVVVSNSRTVANLIGRMSDTDLSRCAIIEPPVLVEASPHEGEITGLRKIAVIGNIFPHKGSEDLSEIAASLRDLAIEFHVFGLYDKRLGARIKRLKLSNVKFHGAYAPGKMGDAVHSCDAALFLSRWPETYCMSLDEALALGLVPIAYRLGALEERISDEVGFLIEIHAQAAVQLIRSLHENPAPLRQRALALRRRAPRPETFIPKYHELFASVLSKRDTRSRQGVTKARPEHMGLEWATDRWDAAGAPASHIKTKKGAISRAWKRMRFWRR